jgi:hypothetical protein
MLLRIGKLRLGVRRGLPSFTTFTFSFGGMDTFDAES